MKKIILLLFLAFVLFNVILASWYVIHGDVNFSSDIARDFFLMQEIHQKKIILIGPRSSVGGLFHGPLWLYLNYPAYLVGNGNPVVVGWYWILLTILFLVSCYFVGKNLFNTTTAYLFVLMTSLYLVYHGKALINPHGALFLLPTFFYFFIKYIKTLKLRYLVFHILLGGAMVQFQIAIGGPMMMLTIIALTGIIVRNHKNKHFITFFLWLLPFSTFILFETRHNFILIHSMVRHFSGGDRYHTFLFFLLERIRVMATGVEFLRGDAIQNGSLYVSLIWVFLLFKQIKDNNHRTIYLAFVYFYVGFFLISLVNRYELLYFYVYPLFPLAFLIFSSFSVSKLKKFFIFIFFIMYAANLIGIIKQVQLSDNIIGKALDDWKFLYKMSATLYRQSDNNFGYFVYSPDVLGYGPRYAMEYTGKFYKNKIFYNTQKKHVTYIVVEPPAKNQPYMLHEWWVKNKLNISSKPVSVINFENGYKIEKYLLTEQETKIPFASDINIGIFYR